MNLTDDRYEQYELRMRAIARVLRWIRRHRWHLIAGALLIAAIFVFIGVVPGIFTENPICQDHVYGEILQYHAKAILSDVSYEFATLEDDATWSQSIPVLAGTYRVRAVSHNGYGKLRYSKETLFTIQPASLQVIVRDHSQIYGDITEYSEANVDVHGLMPGDRLGNIVFTSADVSVSEMSVTVSELTIVNENGIDVTSSYTPSVQSGSLFFSRRAIVLASKSISKNYDGTSLGEPDCELISGSLASGNVITFKHDPSASILLPGTSEARFVAVITDEQGRDVTENYEIDYQYGTIKVTERPITVSISDTSKIYDGIPLSVSEYKITSGSLPVGTNLKLIYETNTAISKVGSLEVKFTAQVIDGNGNDVTAYYALNYDFPTLTITPRSIAFASSNESKIYDGMALTQIHYDITSGTLADGDSVTYSLDPSSGITEVGTTEAKFTAKIVNTSGEDVTDQYVINYKFGKLSIEPRPIRIQTISGNKIYDGKPIKNDGLAIIDGSLVSGHTVYAVYTEAPLYAGEYVNTAQFQITANGGRDVTANYDIQVDFGILRIDHRSLTIQTFGAQKTYDGQPLTSSKWKLSSGSLVKGERLSVTMTGKQTDVGESENTLTPHITDGSGNDITTLGYKITLQMGILRVTPRPIAITSRNAIWLYNGRALKRHEVSYLDTALVLDHTISASFTGSQTNIGSSSNTFTAKIVTGAGKDVSYNYLMTLLYGTLTVWPPDTDITLIPGDGDFITNGDDLLILPDDKDETGEESGTETESEDEYNLGIPKIDSVFTVMQVEFSKGGATFLRQRSYGDYNGRGFSKNVPVYQFTDYNPLSFAALNLSNSGKAQYQSVKVYRQNADESAYLPYYADTLLPKGQNDNTIDYLSKTYSFNTATDYDYRVFEGVTTRSNLRTAELAYRKFVYANYLSVPESTRKVLQSLADANGIYKDSKTLIKDIQSYIQHAATYNLKAKPYPKDVDQVVYFLTIAKEGVCQQYAAAATLMYRMFGIPARYTTGYSVFGEAGVKTDVLNTQAHAWVEIYMDGIGWVAVEVTGGSYATEPKPEPGNGECDGNCDGNCGGASIGGEEMSKLDNVIYAIGSTTDATVLYLREISYGDYTGSGWKHATAYTGIGTKPLYYAGEALYEAGSDADFEYVNIQLRPGCSYLLPYYTTDSYSSAYNETDIDLAFKSASYKIKTQTGLRYRDFLGLDAAPKNKSAEALYRTYVYQTYLHVPDITKNALLEIAKENGISADSPTLITDIQTYIQNCATYTFEEVEFPEDVDVALYFLTEAKEGDCQHFATAATLMYRALGIPARYTCGFMVETEAAQDTPIMGENAHAWVEIYLDGIGWIQMEVTALIEGVTTEMNDKELQVRPDGKLYIDLATPDIEKEYDGFQFDNALTDICIFRKGGLMTGHQMKVTYANNAIIQAGQTIVNEISEICIVDYLGNDVTDQYVLNVSHGTLTVLKRAITIRSIDATKAYDGTELVANKWWISSGSLAKGHKLTVDITGSIINEGTANNMFTYSITDEFGNPVTSQYNVTSLYGILKITP